MVLTHVGIHSIDAIGNVPQRIGNLRITQMRLVKGFEVVVQRVQANRAERIARNLDLIVGFDHCQVASIAVFRGN